MLASPAADYGLQAFCDIHMFFVIKQITQHASTNFLGNILYWTPI